MKTRFSATCLLASALLTTTALAEEQAPAVEAAPAAEAPAPAPAAEPVAPAPAASASALGEKVVAAIGSPEQGKALVVFFRPSKFVGGAVGFKVRENEVELGKLRNGNFFTLQVEPGQHAYDVHSETEDRTTIEAEAGETYFLSGAMGMGVMVGRPNLSPSDAAAFEAALPKLKKSKPLE